MKNFAERTKRTPFEQKLLKNAMMGLIFSALLALGKLVVGLFTDYNLVSIAVYTFALLLAKLQCVLGIKKDNRSFEARNKFIAAFLFVASVIYILFMSRMFFMERTIKNNGMLYVLILAFISFCEFGFALAGLIRTKNSGHFYRDIKIINFCIAIIAILTTQMAILNMMSQTGVVDIANAYAGIGVGCFMAICALYILVAPKTSVIDRERNDFVLVRRQENALLDMQSGNAQIVLCRSFVYGDYVYNAKIKGNVVEGVIERTPSLWKRMHLLLKILCCVLSEILLFVWLAGRGVLFFRSINLPQRLQNKMEANGFDRITPGEDRSSL